MGLRPSDPRLGFCPPLHDAATQKAETDLFFAGGASAYFTNCTLAIIKPHVVAAGLAGEIIDTILEEGFEISAMQMFNLDTPTS